MNAVGSMEEEELERVLLEKGVLDLVIIELDLEKSWCFSGRRDGGKGQKQAEHKTMKEVCKCGTL